MSTLSLSDFRHPFPFKIQRDLCVVMYVEDFLVKPYAPQLDFDVFLSSRGVNLQRGFVWTLLQKRAFIHSILKGTDCGQFSAVHHEHKILRIIDGKQRLSAVLDFLQDRFSFSHDGADYLYSELPKDVADEISRWCPRFHVTYSHDDAPISDEDLIRWFLQINFAGTVQDVSHHAMLEELL